MTAFVVFAHGSRVAAANDAVRQLAAGMEQSSGWTTEAAFLELGQPDLPSATAELISRGATEVFVIPYFLSPGVHLTRDLPRIIEELRSIHKGVTIAATQGLDGHPALLQILLDRASEARTAAAEESV
ncbi:MAG TPA: CbiX/SirB N-terminal domain-containing protein [Bryobacteraceae bacterium]|nr:CbiX/SirB N-terminal domain-containing protein [Bryobacteraceae bacterium]